MTMSRIESMLTDYGTLINSEHIKMVAEKLKVTRYNEHTKKTFTYNMFRRRVIEDDVGDTTVFYQVPRRALSISDVTMSTPRRIIDEDAAVNVFDYQDLVVERIVTDLRKKQGCILQMDTGLGKSFVAAEIICQMRYKTCIVVPNKNLVTQMHDDLITAFESPKINSDGTKRMFIHPTIVTSKKHALERKDWDICILVINTAAKMSYEFYEQFGLVILDEVHCYCSDTFSEIFWQSDTARYVLGMTATPERVDGMESRIKMHLGDTIFAEEIYGDTVDPGTFHGHVEKVEYYGPADYTKVIKSSAGTMSTILMAKQFLEDPIRMSLAASILLDLYNNGRNIYVFCQTKDPLKKLRRKIIKSLKSTTMTELENKDAIHQVNRLGQNEKISVNFSQLDTEEREIICMNILGEIMNDIHVVTGDTKKDAVAAARSEARIFLTTYALSSKGLSLPRFDTLLLLTPMKSNMKQICGRIFRKGSDESIERIIIDIVDAKTPLKRQWYSRAKEYKRRELDVQKKIYPPEQEDTSDDICDEDITDIVDDYVEED